MFSSKPWKKPPLSSTSGSFLSWEVLSPAPETLTRNALSNREGRDPPSTRTPYALLSKCCTSSFISCDHR